MRAMVRTGMHTGGGTCPEGQVSTHGENIAWQKSFWGIGGVIDCGTAFPYPGLFQSLAPSESIVHLPLPTAL
jgi:hypothetical protein